MIVKLEFLSLKTKNMSFHLKDETGASLLKCLVMSSSKQYMITRNTKSAMFPNKNKDSEIVTRKIKGLPRSKHHTVSFIDFSEIAIENKPARKVITARLKRTQFRIYLVKSRKKLLSRFSVKRLFSDRYKTDSSYFSFPLNWRSKIIQ